MRHRSRAVAVTTGLALLGVVALFWLMEQLASSSASPSVTLAMASPSVQATQTGQPTQASASALPVASLTSSPLSRLAPIEYHATPLGTVIARIDDSIITQDEWRTALLLDGMMSQLTQQPLPSAEETLQRLINERLILRAAQLEIAPLPIPEAEARVRRIQEAFGISDRRLSELLTSYGLRWADLTEYTARLILVERGMEILRARHGDFDRWLTQARADASIIVYPASGLSSDEGGAPSTLLPEASSTPTVQVTQQDTHPAQETQLIAPDFTLDSAQGISVTLSDYRHRAAVVLVFYRGQT